MSSTPLPETNTDYGQKYFNNFPLKRPFYDQIISMADMEKIANSESNYKKSTCAILLILYEELVNLKKNQIELNEKLIGINTKLDTLMDALALTPDSDEVKRQNAETMAKIGAIKLEEVKIAEEQKKISG